MKYRSLYIAICCLLACGQTNPKPAENPIIEPVTNVIEPWSEYYKTKFIKGCKVGFGEVNINYETTVDKYCKCCLNEVMSSYSSSNEWIRVEKKMTQDDFMRMALPCAYILDN